MNYQLIAARDGNILYEMHEFQDMARAEDWAFKKIADHFGLDRGQYVDFVEICGDTDGVRLEAA